ncbi:MAG TPA: PQQ-dependent sugar dehydrogenase [Thermoanaerobaculia bacterium]|jgi:glucose/arabinose dehydrogenase|nr:PQQ-dependent sugar dehydrogenase [Thermoanaerobaculia bacterium]
MSTRLHLLLLGALGLSLVLSLAVSAPGAAQGSLVQRVPIVPSGLTAPVGVTHAGDGSGRLFIVEQVGRIRIWDGTQLLPTPFLTVSVGPGCGATDCGERGLLGLAFHPNYESNGFFYVYYTRPSDGDIVIARYHVSGNPNVADPSSALVLLTIEHSSQANHNGGQLAFGPDGYLYAGVGDGGGGGDPFESGQNKDSLLGKILRIDVDHPSPGRNYGIPAGNPFAGATAGADEVWDFGLRNPWRFSFDRQTGDLFIGDVGQGTWEEIDIDPASNGGGHNFGWDCREGAHNYTDPNGDMNAGCGSVASIDPVLEYDHSLGCSVTGGFVYRGGVESFLSGNYIFGDYCSGRIWRGTPGTGGSWTRQEFGLPASFGLTSFGESENGRLYLTYSGGSLHWIAPYTFSDVPPTHASWPFVEAISEAGITAGCTAGPPPSFCPDQDVSRAEMAIFLLRGRHGESYAPPPATGTVFADVAATSFGAAWIEQLFNEGLTAGCATNPRRYCPTSNARRDEMAVFLLRAKHGSGYTPPAATGTVFADVPASYWAAPWIERLYSEGITAGCATGPPRYCPDGIVSRGSMAAFLSRTFALPLP